jgi:hypothetical protein
MLQLLRQGYLHGHRILTRKGWILELNEGWHASSKLRGQLLRHGCHLLLVCLGC